MLLYYILTQFSYSQAHDYSLSAKTSQLHSECCKQPLIYLNSMILYLISLHISSYILFLTLSPPASVLIKELISIIHNMIELLKIKYLEEKQAIYRQNTRGSQSHIM